MDLELSFVQLCRNQKIPGAAFDVYSVFQDILHHYATPGRYYHNLSHIKLCLQKFCQIQHLIPDPDAVQMALWFHDIIYVPGQHTNEERSAAFFLDLTQSAFKSDFMEKVVHLIMATTHKELSNDKDECFTADIDLSSFGLPWDKFLMDSTLLRQERMDMTTTAYNKANNAFLKRLLARKRIFQTDVFYNRLEHIAIQNINRLIKQRESPEQNDT